MDDVCGICMEDLVEGVCPLPGCEHRFHLSCLLESAQYDVRCPMCRRTPSGVRVKHSMEAERVEGVDDARVEEGVVDIEGVRLQWRRFVDRRRRLLYRNPILHDVWRRLKQLTVEVNAQAHTTQRLYDNKCRLVWRDDPDVIVARQHLSRLRRRQRRLQRTIDAVIEPPTLDELMSDGRG